MTSARVPLWVWIVLVLAHSMVLVWALRSGSWEFADSGRYIQAAQNMKQMGQFYARPWPISAPTGQAVQEFSIRTLGYPLLVMVVSDIGRLPISLLIIQNLLSILTIAGVLRWWARWANPQRGQWVLAVLCVLTFPAQLIYANAVMSEIALQTVVLVGMGFGLKYIISRASKFFFAMTLAVIAALLLKPVFYPFACIIAVIGLVEGWRRRKGGLVAMGLLPVLVVVGYMEWNQQRTGYFHFSSIAEINLLHYNAAGVVRQVNGPQGEEEWVAGVLHEAQRQPDFAARQRLIQQRAWMVLKVHPWVYARQHALGMLAFFLDPGRFDISEFLHLVPLAGGGFLTQVRTGGLLTAVQHLPLGLVVGLGVVLLTNIGRLVLAAQGFWCLRKGQRDLRYGRWVALGLLGYVALLTGPLGASRFLVPVWPVLLGLALVGIKSRVTESGATAAVGGAASE